jgi:hypothetical protein
MRAYITTHMHTYMQCKEAINRKKPCCCCDIHTHMRAYITTHMHTYMQCKEAINRKKPCCCCLCCIILVVLIIVGYFYLSQIGLLPPLELG